MRIKLDPSSVADYEKFLRIKSMPQYRFIGRTAEFPDEYIGRLGSGVVPTSPSAYVPHFCSSPPPRPSDATGMNDTPDLAAMTNDEIAERLTAEVLERILADLEEEEDPEWWDFFEQ